MLVHVTGQTVYPSSDGVGKQRIIWLVRWWLIDVFWKLCCALIFFPMSASWVINLWTGYGAMDPLYIMWLSELGIFAMFRGLKNYSITETDILWYDLHEYICYYSCDLCISSPLLPWPCLPCIMNYPLCMTHDLATANHHGHAWTEKWAHNICKLSMPMSLVRLLSSPREHRQRGRLYRMYGTCKNYPPRHALLNVGSMTVLRWADCFILIWTCSAVLPDHRNCHFHNYPSFKRNPHKNKK